MNTWLTFTSALLTKLAQFPVGANTLEVHEFDLWLAGTVDEAKTLLKLAPVEVFDAGPAPASIDPPAKPPSGAELG